MLHSDKAIAVGDIPSGLFIVAVNDTTTGKPDGYLASFVQQVSFNPLIVALAIKPGRPAYDLIKSGQVFAINVVGDNDKTYLKHFWKGYDPATNPFTELPYSLGEFGGLVINQSKSAIECKFISSTRPGDHEVVFAEVLASHINAPEAKPMIHLRKSGADY